MARLCILAPSRSVQNFRPIGAEMAELNSFFEFAIAPRRNAMRARYKDHSENTTNGVGMITPLHSAYTESGVRRGGGWSQDEAKFQDYACAKFQTDRLNELRKKCFFLRYAIVPHGPSRQ